MHLIRARLLAICGPVKGTAWSLGHADLRIGRGREVEICLPDAAASRNHAVIVCEGDGFQVEDLGSTNGTRVNGEPVRQATLAAGDQIQIGHTVFEFQARRDSI